MITIITKEEKNGGYNSDVTLDNATVYEILTALDATLDALEGHGVSKLAVIDYVINRETYIDKKEEK